MYVVVDGVVAFLEQVGEPYINKVVLTLSTYFSTFSPLRNHLIPTIFTRYSSHFHRVIFYTQQTYVQSPYLHK